MSTPRSNPRKRRVIPVLLAVLALGLLGFGGWLWRLPTPGPAQARAVPAEETAALLAALQPPKRARPLVAVLGLNDATETTDYLLPTSVLRRADVAEVRMLAPDAGPVRLYPALTVQPDATLADFDARHPEGADYVIVPAMSRDDDPAVLAWLQAQAKRGATVIGVCAGAKVVGAAGLLDGRRATTHWYFVEELRRRSPTVQYVPDRRMVADRSRGTVVTTTGISASMPAMLTLVEAIAGRAKAEAVARELGVPAWSAAHDSRAFQLTRPFATTVLGNVLKNAPAFWQREPVGVQLRPGMDEAALALVADAWSRTYRSAARPIAESAGGVTTRHGVRVLPDADAGQGVQVDRHVLIPPGQKPAEALDQALAGIAARYGPATAEAVALQLEYPGWPAGGGR